MRRLESYTENLTTKATLVSLLRTPPAIMANSQLVCAIGLPSAPETHPCTSEPLAPSGPR